MYLDSLRETKEKYTHTGRHTHYLRISRSKTADVVVDLLEDKASVHEGETSLEETTYKGKYSGHGKLVSNQCLL